MVSCKFVLVSLAISAASACAATVPQPPTRLDPWWPALAGAAVAAALVHTAHALHARRLNHKCDQAATELRQARDRAGEFLHAKAKFLAILSHEIRTPLNGVIGLNSLLQEMDLPRPAKDLLAMQQMAARSLVQLVNDLLDYGKIETGRVEIERRRFSPLVVVEECTLPIRAAAHAKGLEFRVTGPDARSTPFVWGDPHRLGQVLSNVIGNAVKNTIRGSVDLEWTLKNTADASGTLEFVIRDTGVGIAREQLQSAFDAAHRAEPSSSGRFGGAGLGLAISRSLVELLGGTIAVESELGKGSEFRISIPVGIASAEEPETGTGGAERTQRSACQSLKILLAEDNLINQRVTSRMLERLGHSVHAVSDGQAAVDAACRTSYDLVLMDVQMPHKDGLAAAREIRERLAHSAQPHIVALTANAVAGDRERCLAAGMDGYIAKPVELRALRLAIEAGNNQRASSPSTN